MGMLLIRELNVNGCGDLTRLNNEQECPDTDDVVEEAVKNTLGETARCIGYALLEYGGGGHPCDEKSR